MRRQKTDELAALRAIQRTENRALGFSVFCPLQTLSSGFCPLQTLSSGLWRFAPFRGQKTERSVSLSSVLS
ncbi:MAG: hypothetical protein LBD06_00690, partial [Candidatus Accumulibacter sp.]|nr:hypothetical protein [Accumulibacter sp.]